jgi:hypothetical protein
VHETKAEAAEKVEHRGNTASTNVELSRPARCT